ncbi:hypothetical protein ACTQ54_00850 [Fundicoccus sp. Sow4_H7]|uniref:hypothetical protein n=1 Tax=Fundicoccus sp. Sow4_H7 TaxID=3438784 RepID=UPI003F92FE35
MYKEVQHVTIDGQAYLALYKENETEAYTVRDNGQVSTPTNEATAYKVITHSTNPSYHDLGDIYLDEEKIGNVFFITNSSSPFRMAKGMFLWLSYSDDEGQA